jgi:hypothetical protein
MRSTTLKSILKTATLALAGLLLTASASFAQINLTAGPTTAVMPDGTAVPMWGYTCGAAVAGYTATCAALNPNAPAATTTTPAGWSPVVITVPTGTALTINLTNNLSFTGGTVPTSIMIVGQLGGGLGGLPTTTPSPTHTTTATTWPSVVAGTFTAPAQGPRVQSFGTEVAAGTTTALSWPDAAHPGATLRPGTYLFESGTHPSIQVPMGLYGILVVTCAPGSTTCVGATPGTAYPGVGTAGTPGAVPAITYAAELPIEFGEIDPVQNKAVSTAVNTVGFSETKVWSGQPGGCGNPASAVGVVNTCYPPAVNYTPLYYTINGVAFNKTNSAFSLFPAKVGAATTGITGTILVRMVNAGSHMHVPSIVGAVTTETVGTTSPVVTTPGGFSLMAEDGNPLPGVPRVQTDVFMAAGKVFDVMINAPAAGAPALPIYDRELSLSGNGINRDSGMLAYIGVNGSALPAAGGLAPAVARADVYNSLVTGQPLMVSDPAKGLIANDTNVFGVTVMAPVTGLTLNANGTFTYTGAPTTFTYCANGTVTAGVCSSGVTASVTLGATTVADSGITCNATTFNSTMATYLAVKTPGLLAGCKDAANLPITVNTATVAATGMTVRADANGGFTASGATAGTHTFTVTVQDSQLKTATANVSVVFPTASNLAVTVLDGKDKTTVITDYRWIIEEDKTFYVNPNCTTNTTTPAAGCPSQSATNGVSPVLGVNFHTDYMPMVAQGCTGTLSCEGGQTVFDPVSGTHVNAVCDVGNGLCRPDTTGN